VKNHLFFPDLYLSSKALRTLALTWTLSPFSAAFSGVSREIDVESVTGGHQVSVVDKLKEGLDVRSGGDSLKSHLLVHSEGLSVDSSNECVSEGASLAALVESLDDDGLDLMG